MIKVTHSFPIWLPQTQTWLYNQVKHAPVDQIESHIACERTENLDQFYLPNIHTPSKIRHFFDRALRKLRIQKHASHTLNALKKTGSQILHSHFGDIAWGNVNLAKKLGVKHTASFYGRDVSMLPKKNKWRLRYKELFKNAGLILCEGPHMAACVEALGCPAHKIKIQRLGVDTLKLPYKKRTWKKGDTLKVLISGSFRQKKGIPYALKALAEIQDEVPMKITIIGDAINHPDQVEKQKILKTINEKNLGKVTVLKGLRPYDALIKEAYENHLFVSPSISADNGDTEGGAPVTIVEMSVTGMPIATTNHCDIPYVLKEYEKTLFSNERDVSSLVLVLKLFLENWDEHDPMLERQAAYIEKNYNHAFLGRNIAKLYAALARPDAR